jgi:hypothetical protein
VRGWDARMASVNGKATSITHLGLYVDRDAPGAHLARQVRHAQSLISSPRFRHRAVRAQTTAATEPACEVGYLTTLITSLSGRPFQRSKKPSPKNTAGFPRRKYRLQRAVLGRWRGRILSSAGRVFAMHLAHSGARGCKACAFRAARRARCGYRRVGSLNSAIGRPPRRGR